MIHILDKFRLKIAAIGLTFGLALFSKLIAFSWIVGAQRTFFSGMNITGPLTVIFGGLPGGLLYLALSLFSFKTNFLLASGLPNLLAGFYWKTSSRFIKLVLPILAMSLFWYQTWGTLAAWYAVLWLIPVVIGLRSTSGLFGKSLAATFIAHAVGSNLWLYLGQVGLEQWFGIIPLALVERFCLAILMVGAYNLVQFSLKILSLFNSKCKKGTEIEQLL